MVIMISGIHQLSESDKLEDNSRGQLKSNRNSPSGFRGYGHTILVGAP